MIKVGVVGGTGYTGVELLRLLVSHPQVELVAITSRSEAGKKVSDCYANLRGHLDLEFTEPAIETLAQCDLVFFATPNGIAMKSARELLERGVRVIDLAADFRINDISVWEKWYGMSHACPDLVAEAVYGLPEINRASIKGARLVANPGCYPTAVQLGFLPLLEQGLVESAHLIADAKSGTSGAGRQASVGTLYCEVTDNFHAYAASAHRHTPEIKQGLAAMTGREVGLTFVPHLLPVIRGIHATLYATLKDPDMDIQSVFENRYADETFVDVMPAGTHPETRSVRGDNTCRIAVHRQEGSATVIILSVIDNLVKGAAGQAVQNLNIMFGIEESEGLDRPALLP